MNTWASLTGLKEILHRCCTFQAARPEDWRMQETGTLFMEDAGSRTIIPQTSHNIRGAEPLTTT